jgi:hypothetical protein
VERVFAPLYEGLVLLCLGIALVFGSASAVAAASPASPAAPSSASPAASESYDPDLKLGSSCRGRPSAAVLKAALPTYLKELVVQWPRAGKRKGPSGCISVARLTLVDHQGVITTLSVEVHGAPQPIPEPDYRLIEDDDMPRAVFSLRPSSELPQIVVSLAGPPAAPRDSLERSLEFVPVDALVQGFGALLKGE